MKSARTISYRSRVPNLFLLGLLASLSFLVPGWGAAQPFRTLYDFTAGDYDLSQTYTPVTNGDGRVPWSALLLSSNILYGTAAAAGLYGSGTVFALNTDGTGFRSVYNFSALDTSSFPYIHSAGRPHKA